MKAVVTRKEIESALHERFGDVFERDERLLPEILPTGIGEIDTPLGGFPRGAITEIYGPASSGRTSLVLSALATATAHEEICAVIDCHDTFDLSSAANAGVDFKRVLWVRCRSNLERAFKATDLVSHAGGFGFVVLNLCDVPVKAMRRIITSWWFRFRRAIENTPTALIILTPVAAVRSCATLALALKNEREVWPSAGSLVCKKFSGDIVNSKQQRHLSIVRSNIIAPPNGEPPAHSRFLRTTRIHVNRERPMGFHQGRTEFHPQLSASRLAMFEDIR